MQIAVLASGDSAPGTNAAVRVMARRTFARRWGVAGAETGCLAEYGEVERRRLDNVISIL